MNLIILANLALKNGGIQNGKFKILHQILPLENGIYFKIILIKSNISNLNISRLGCGGGLTCEPLARLGANLTGIDFVKKI